MNNVQKESFIKSFTLFFGSLSVLIFALFYINFTQEVQTLDNKLFSQMRVCSFDLKCKNFEIDFIKKNGKDLYYLYKNEKGLYSYYPIPNSTKHIMELHFSSEKYDDEINILIKSALLDLSVVLMIVLLLSIVFSIYALYPLKNALILTEEFIKDILHDFNTPISSLRLNSSMLKKEIGESEKINRIEHSVAEILSLQNHLRSYLHNHDMKKEKFNLTEIIKQQIDTLKIGYPQIKYNLDIKDVKIEVNKEAFSRIVANILTNASKYNKNNGFVKITYDETRKFLTIADSGKGIKDTTKIFDRFYKEQDRGIGIGLHIVKKLCDELNINISVKSKVGEGSEFSLDISKLILG